MAVKGKVKDTEKTEMSKTSPITPQPEYAMPILKSLIELGGSARVQEVLNKVYDKMSARFTPADLEILPSGREPRWRNHAKWERMVLKNERLLKSNSPFGVWEISDKGRNTVEE